MNSLSPRVHGTIDYLFVVFFLLAPTIFHFSGLPATLSIGIALAHLTLSLCTAYPLGLVKAIPLAAHGWFELVAGTGLVLLPWIFSFSEATAARNFFMTMGSFLLVTWFASDYLESRQGASHHGGRE